MDVDDDDGDYAEEEEEGNDDSDEDCWRRLWRWDTWLCTPQCGGETLGQPSSATTTNQSQAVAAVAQTH